MFNIGIVGVGGMGVVHFKNYEHIENANVIAVCDFTESAKAFAESNNVLYYRTIEDMLQNDDLDIIDICTPTYTHRENILKATKAQKHVICEKPLDLSLAGARQAIESAEEAGVMLFVGQVLQYSQEAIALHRLVESGAYGKVLDAQFLRLSACPRWIKNNWMFQKEKSGLLPFDLHIHDLDLILSLFGVPEAFGYTCCGNADKDYKEHYRFTYVWPDKSVSAEAAWYNADIPFTATWRVYFENAVAVNDGKAVTVYSFGNPPEVLDTTEKIKVSTGINIPPTGMFITELTSFLSQIAPGKCGCPRKDTILTTIALLEAILNGSEQSCKALKETKDLLPVV